MCRENFRELKRRTKDRLGLKAKKEGYYFNLWLPVVIWLGMLVLTFLEGFVGECLGFGLDMLSGHWLPGLFIDINQNFVEEATPEVKGLFILVLTVAILIWIVLWLRDPPIRIALKRKS